MKLATACVVASALSLALSLSACASSGADTKNLTALIKTLQDDKACDRVRDIDVGAGAGQLGGEGHASFKEHSECGAGHGLKAGAMVSPTTAPAPTIPAQPVAPSNP
jgi:hypothetical protein